MGSDLPRGCMLVLLALLALPLLLPDLARAEDASEIEILDDFEILDVEPAEGSPGLLTLAGELHPAVVHLPIGWILLLVLAELAALRPAWAGLHRWTLPLLGLTALSYLPAAVTGLLSYRSYAEPDPAALLHRNLMVLGMLLCWSAVGVRWRTGPDSPGWMRWVYLGLLLAALALTSAGGHVGGVLVHGELGFAS